MCTICRCCPLMMTLPHTFPRSLVHTVGRFLSAKDKLSAHQRRVTNYCSRNPADGGNSITEPVFELSPYFHPQASAPPPPATFLNDTTCDVMELLLRERVVFLGTEINDFIADATIGQLLLLDAQDPTKDIRLFINSPGGSLSGTLAIYDVIQHVRADVSTLALGMAASTSSLILGGGTKGKRLAMPNARIMIQQPLGGADGEALNVEIQAKENLFNKYNVIRIISGFTGRTFEEVAKDIEKDYYMSPIEAVEYGIIDGVLNRDSVISLTPVPGRTKVNLMELEDDPHKYLVPEIPDDEIY